MAIGIVRIKKISVLPVEEEEEDAATFITQHANLRPALPVICNKM